MILGWAVGNGFNMNDKNLELSEEEVESATELFDEIVGLIESGDTEMVKITPEEAVEKVTKFLEEKNDGH